MSFFFIMRFLYVFAWVYLAWRVSSGLNLRRPYNIYLYAGFIITGLLSFLFFLNRRADIGLPSFMVSFANISMGVCGIAVTFFIINDIINLFNLLTFKIKKFRYYSTFAAVWLSVLASVWAVLNPAFILNAREITIEVPELRRESLRIALLSDVHIDRFTRPETIKKIFAKTQSLDPDIIVLTGDIIDYDINENDKFLDYGFGLLRAPYGVFAVTGNHERRRLDAYFEMCKKLGIKILRNENVLIEGMLNIAGINDSDWRGEAVIKETLRQADAQYPVLFLSHRPETFDTASEQGIKILQLSGHTHAGQIPPVETVRKLFMRYNYGIYRKNASVMYVTSGTRWWGPPMRFGSVCEIAVITLERGRTS